MTSNTLWASVNFFGHITIHRYFVFVSTVELRTLYIQEQQRSLLHEHARPLNKRCAWRPTKGSAFIKMTRLKAIIAIILLVGLGECARVLTKCVVCKKTLTLSQKRSRSALTYPEVLSNFIFRLDLDNSARICSVCRIALTLSKSN